jgi:hypothetical protein
MSNLLMDRLFLIVSILILADSESLPRFPNFF